MEGQIKACYEHCPTVAEHGTVVSCRSYFKGKYQFTLLTLIFLKELRGFFFSFIHFVLLYLWHQSVLYSPVSMHARLFSILTKVQCVVVASTFSDVSVKVTQPRHHLHPDVRRGAAQHGHVQPQHQAREEDEDGGLHQEPPR